MRSFHDMILSAAAEQASESKVEEEAFIKGALFALGLYPHRVIRHVSELDSLATFSVIIDKDGDAWQKTDQDDGLWVQIGVPPLYPAPELVTLEEFLPAVVLLDIPVDTVRHL